MPRTRSILWSQLKLGITGVLTVLLVIVVVLAVGGQGGFWWQRYPLFAIFDQVGGLKTGAVVRLNGKDVGQVRELDFAGSRIRVEMQLSRDVRSLVTTESVATIGALSLLGDPIVDITASTTGTPLPDGGQVKAGAAAAGIGGLAGTAQQGVERLNRIIEDVQSGRGTIGKLLTDEEVYRELARFSTSAANVSHALEAGEGTIGGLLKDRAAYESLKTSLANLQASTERLKSGNSALARLLNDEPLGRSLSSAVTNLEEVTAGVRRGDGTVGRLLTDRELYDQLTSVSTRVNRVIAGIESGEGTLGQALHNRELYDNMNTAVAELRGLLADIRKDPKKFLRVSVSIF